MPIIDGKIVRSRFTSLKLGEISSVDNPAQPGALGCVIKRMEDPAQAAANIAKYICDDDGAHTFSEVLEENKFSEEIWPYTDALSQSIRSIVGDDAVGADEREQKINASVAEFLAAVRTISPEVSKRLQGLISKREDTMPKTVEQVEKDLAAATASLAAAEKARDAAVAAKMTAEEAKDKMSEELEETKKALVEATDDVIKVEGVEVRKSVVGETQFNVTKALAAKADRAELEARAEKRFPTLIGSAAVKAAMLKAAEGLGDEESELRKGAVQMLEAAERMTAKGFERYGVGDPDAQPTAKAAKATFDGKVSEIQKRDSCTPTEAMKRARREFPVEFEASQQTVN